MRKKAIKTKISRILATIMFLSAIMCNFAFAEPEAEGIIETIIENLGSDENQGDLEENEPIDEEEANIETPESNENEPVDEEPVDEEEADVEAPESNGNQDGSEKESVDEEETAVETTESEETQDASDEDGIMILSDDASDEDDIMPLSGGTRKVTVWDFGNLKVEGNDTNVYDYVDVFTVYKEPTTGSAETLTLNAGTAASSSGAATYTFGGSSGDLSFLEIKGSSTSFNSNQAAGAYVEGTDAEGNVEYKPTYGLYGAGGVSTNDGRYLVMKNVKAGDTIKLYVKSTNGNTGSIQISKEEDTNPSDLVSSAGGSGTLNIVEYIAQSDGTYKIFPKGIKPGYNKVMRIPAVTVSGTITDNRTSASSLVGETITFTRDSSAPTSNDEDLNIEITATIESDGTYNVDLPVNSYLDNSYTAKINLANGKINSEQRNISISANNSVSGKESNFTIVDLETEALSGSITGFANGYDTSKLKLSFKPSDPNSTSDTVSATIDKSAMTFNAELETEVEYVPVIEGVNDYSLKEKYPITVTKGTPKTLSIKVEAKALHNISGGYVEGYGCDDTAITAIEFTNVDDSYKYYGTVSADGFTAKLRDGAYSIEVGSKSGDTFTKSTTYSVPLHIVVKGADVEKDLMFKSLSAAPAITYAENIYVDGSADTNTATHHYKTVREAVKAAEAMTRTDAQRVTIHIAPGTYREQVIISKPNITLINDDSSREVKLTWYYGIGYNYYSANSDGFYDEFCAYDKYEKHGPARWGCTVRVDKEAFRAENIIFENSFNIYMTKEEVADGVEVSEGSENTQSIRDQYLDVTRKDATERAAAIVNFSDKSEFYKCEFLSSQDTLYTGNKTNQYYKNCLISGNTDYIFGGGNVVFDSCELNIYGYKETKATAYITAFRDNDNVDANGYIFRNCTITQNSNLQQTPSYFGRPWGSTAKVAFINTKLANSDAINEKGWSAWEPSKPLNYPTDGGNFKEYNTTYNGEPVDTSKRPKTTDKSTVITKADVDAAEYNNVVKMLNNYKPYYYEEESNSAPVFKTEGIPIILSNDDINSPKTGDTLSVGYEFEADADNKNDASLITWYRVDDEGVKTLIKSTGASVDGAKKYTLVSEDIGYLIEVSVAAENSSGLKGETKTSITQFKVIKGSQTSGGIDLPSSGVNIYIAGDSTVKSYLTAEDKGGWGEFLQNYFNEKYVKVLNNANGGRSTRNFINEGSLAKIASTIKEGDYLLIQFGHNDCASQKEYYLERFVGLGEPNANGIYPTTPAEKTATPAALADKKYGDTYYPYDSGTFKWYLKQYIDTAKAAGATPILVTPVPRAYMNADGTIKTHHDAAKNDDIGVAATTGNAYVTAMKQLGEEQDVKVIDLFTIGSDILTTAWKENGDTDVNDVTKSSVSNILAYSSGKRDTTHYNKVGAAIQAAEIAYEIMNMDLPISPTVVKPANAAGTGPNNTRQFTFDEDNIATAFSPDDYTVKNEYWTKILNGIVEKLVPVNNGDENTDTTTEANIETSTDTNTGDDNTGDTSTGDDNIGDTSTGDDNIGDTSTGDDNIGDTSTGDDNIGDTSTGDTNTGDTNTGDTNTGDTNTGDTNTGDTNTGDTNTGDTNTGDTNTGDDNNGDDNTGAENPTESTTSSGSGSGNGSGSGGGSSSSGGGSGSGGSSGGGGSSSKKASSGSSSAGNTSNTNSGDSNNTSNQSNGNTNNTGSQNSSGNDGSSSNSNQTNAAITSAGTLTTPAGIKINPPALKNSAGQVIAGSKLNNSNAVQSNKFTDTASRSWAQNSINKLVSIGVINGVGNNQFAPDSVSKRGDFMVMLTKVLGINEAPKSTFSDVPSNMYYANAVNIAKDIGLASGTGDNLFQPEAPIKRQDMMVLVAKALEIVGYDVNSADVSVLNSYVDAGNIADYAKPYVAYLISQGLVNGTSESTITPSADMTRAQMAVLMSNLYDKIADTVADAQDDAA